MSKGDNCIERLYEALIDKKAVFIPEVKEAERYLTLRIRSLCLFELHLSANIPMSFIPEKQFTRCISTVLLLIVAAAVVVADRIRSAKSDFRCETVITTKFI